MDEKWLVSILTFLGVVWLPNNTKPWHPICAAKWAGPVSFDITYFAPISSFDNWKKFVGLLLWRHNFTLYFFAAFISPGPGAITISKSGKFDFNFKISSL